MFVAFSKLIWNSWKHHTLITLFIMLSVSISLTFLTITVSAIQTQVDQIHYFTSTKTITFKKNAPITELEKLKAKWKEAQWIQAASITGNPRKLPIQYNDKISNYYISPYDPEQFQMNGRTDIDLKNNEVYISVQLASKLLGSDIHIENPKIIINNKPYIIKYIDKEALGDFITLNYKNAPYKNVESNNVQVVTTNDQAITKIMNDLKPYKPTLSDLETSTKKEAQQRIIFLVVVAILLLMIALINFIQLYNYKLSLDENKWYMLTLLGANQRTVQLYMYMECLAICFIAFLLSGLEYTLFHQLIDSTFLKQTFKLPVFIILNLVAMIVMMLIVGIFTKKFKMKFNF